MPDLAGRTLGSYRLVEQTAIGGMAIIFKAYDEALDRYVAIKILPDYLSRDPDFSVRFRNEARNVARLRHPNILPIFGYGEEDGLSYFVMDLVEGGTLKDIMGTPLPPERVEPLITQVAGALNYAHEHGVVHRDVKPSNVLMLRPDWALLSDFGIARVLEQTSNVTHTGSAFFGTPHYMAPEQARGEQVTPMTDQYALGIVLYEMLTGTTPYRADTPQAVVYQHIYSAPPPPREKNAAISPAMEAIILRTLSKDPAERYPTMADFTDAVRNALSPGSVSTVPSTDPGPAPIPDLSQSFPAQSATPAFRPAETDTKSKTGPFTERIEVTPQPTTAAEESSVEVPAPAHRGFLLTSLLLGGGAVVLLLAVLAFFVFRGSSAPAAKATVRVDLVAPASVTVSRFSIVHDGGAVASGAPNSSTLQVHLAPGRYVFHPIDSDGLAFPVRFAVSSSASQIVRLDRLYGRLSIVPVAGRVSVPGLDLQRGAVSEGVSTTAATQGAYVAPGRYIVGFYPSEFPFKPRVLVRAGRTTPLNLSRIFGHLSLAMVAGGPASGLSIRRRESGVLVTGIDSSQEVGGVFIPPGRFWLVFDNSDAYPDPVPVTVRAGQSVHLDLNSVLARLVLPAAPSDTLMYSWREAGTLRTLTATPQSQTVYVRAGTHRVEINRNNSTRVITIHAVAGSTVHLPPR